MLVSLGSNELLARVFGQVGEALLLRQAAVHPAPDGSEGMGPSSGACACREPIMSLCGLKATIANMGFVPMLRIPDQPVPKSSSSTSAGVGWSKSRLASAGTTCWKMWRPTCTPSNIKSILHTSWQCGLGAVKWSGGSAAVLSDTACLVLQDCKRFIDRKRPILVRMTLLRSRRW